MHAQTMQDCMYSWMYTYACTSAWYQMHTLTYTSMDTPTDMPQPLHPVTHHPSSPAHHSPCCPSTCALSQPWFILAHAMPVMLCIHVAPSVLACVQPSMPLAHVPTPISWPHVEARWLHVHDTRM